MPLKRECSIPSSEVTIQLGRPMSLDPRFTEGILRFCQDTPHIAACHILDARRPATGELTMIIAVTLDDEAKQLDDVITRFKSLLPQLPSQAERTMITAATPMLLTYAGEEYYRREWVAPSPLNRNDSVGKISSPSPRPSPPGEGES